MNYRRRLLSLYGCFSACQRFLLVCLAGGLTFAPLAHAQTGGITPSPNPCIIAGGAYNCTSTIGWNSTGTSAVQVWVSVNGGAESLFASSGAGVYSQNATWIGPGASYVFRLYDYSGGTRGATLDSETVTGYYSVSLTFNNPSRTLGTNFVVGDYWSLTVYGAPANVAVAVYWTNQTGGSSGLYTAGYTGLDGSFSASYLVTTGNVGRYAGQWYLNGATFAMSFNMEVIPVPTSLFPQPGTTYDCPAGQPQPYGFGLDEVYHLSGLTFGDVNIPITAQSAYAGSDWNTSVSLGSLPNFQDAATVGECSGSAFVNLQFQETIYLLIGGPSTTIRTNNFTTTSTSPHSGEISNGGDIDVTR